MSGKKLMKTILVMLVLASLGACSTMKATDSGYLSNRSNLTFSQDGSTGKYRAPVAIDPRQIVSSTVEWFTKTPVDLDAAEKEQLLLVLSSGLNKKLGELPAVSNGRAVVLRAAITRVEVVSPRLNTLATVALIGPVDRGGAAVEIELLDAQTRMPLASFAKAHYAPMSEFRARFSRLAPAEISIKKAAEEFSQLVLAGTE